MVAPPAESEPTRFVESLRERAEEEGIAVPDDVIRFLDVVDRDPRFREALSRLGFHFDEDELGLDILPELDIEGFVSIWGNGYGDAYGGITPDGVAILWWKEIAPRNPSARSPRTCANRRRTTTRRRPSPSSWTSSRKNGSASP